jgi:hypothetical protein
VFSAETYVPGPEVQSDAADWLQEHLGGNFEKAWSNPMLTPYDKPSDLWWSQEQDAAIKVKALSRWNNYCEWHPLKHLQGLLYCSSMISISNQLWFSAESELSSLSAKFLTRLAPVCLCSDPPLLWMF